MKATREKKSSQLTFGEIRPFPHLWPARRSGIACNVKYCGIIGRPPEEPEDEEWRGLLQLFLSQDGKKGDSEGEKLLPRQPS